LRFNHDAASAVEDVKLPKPRLDLIRLSQLQASDREFQRNLQTNHLTVFLLCSPMPKWQWDILTIFRTEWNVEELIALIGDYRVARAAFDEAVKRRPGRIVTLRQNRPKPPW
jgi:NAD(P)-dependent dehydrogenase (short-subunit alcohol dehydrogenase family)